MPAIQQIKFAPIEPTDRPTEGCVRALAIFEDGTRVEHTVVFHEVMREAKGDEYVHAYCVVQATLYFRLIAQGEEV